MTVMLHLDDSYLRSFDATVTAISGDGIAVSYTHLTLPTSDLV